MRFGIVLAATAIGLVSAPALAADIGAVEPLPAPAVVEAAPVNDWTGFYLGALAGWSWGNADTDATVGEIEADGWDAGAYAGANWQFGSLVVGAEADALFSGVEGSAGAFDVEQGVTGSLRARAGIALDRFLLYGTGGAALTDLELSNAAGSDEQMLWGWTVGAGAEAMLANNITARVEYRYTDYQDETFTLGGAGVESDFSDHSLRAGVGVKF
jgi:outer membrane immunogenic protein